MDKEKMLGKLLKGAIIAAGTGIGIMVAKCFSVEKDPDEGEPDDSDEVIDVEFEKVSDEEV